MRRPRDRRQQIIRAAAEQFRANGYPNVGIGDIATDVGIAASAVYRHFDGKQALLQATIDEAVDHFVTVWTREYSSVDELFTAICATALQHKEIGVLWAREAEHLPAEARRLARGRVAAALAPIRSAIGSARPDLSLDDLDFLTWAVIGVSISTGDFTVKLGEARYRARLVSACHAVCFHTEVPADGAPGPAPDAASSGELLPASRTEAILVSATRLFCARGYRDVGVEDIGAAAGVTGAAVYHHFPSKSAILTAVVTRCLQAMFFDLSNALRTSADAQEALCKLLTFYVRTRVENGPVLGRLFGEAMGLPADERGELRRTRLDYVAEWVALLERQRPDLPSVEAEVLVHAALSAINTIMNMPHLTRRPGLSETLVAVGAAILGLDDTSPDLSTTAEPNRGPRRR